MIINRLFILYLTYTFQSITKGDFSKHWEAIGTSGIRYFIPTEQRRERQGRREESRGGEIGREREGGEEEREREGEMGGGRERESEGEGTEGGREIEKDGGRERIKKTRKHFWRKR